jgi:MFS family permease
VTAEDSLWRNRSFLAVWGGQLVSTLGSRIGGTALPLLVLATTGSPADAGVVGAAAVTPLLLLSLPFGALADRWPRRRLMLGSQVVAAGTFAGVAVVVLAGRVTVPHLAAAAFVGGACSVCYGVAEHAALPQIVPAALLPAALAQNEAKVRGAGLAGPPLGGFLYGLGAAVPFLVDAVSSAVAAACLTLVRSELRPARTADPGRTDPGGAGPGAAGPGGAGPREAGAGGAGPGGAGAGGAGAGRAGGGGVGPRGAGPGGADAGGADAGGARPGRADRGDAGPGRAGSGGSLGWDITAGLVFLWRHRFVRAAVLLIAASNFVFQALVLVLVVVATDRGASPSTVGLMFGIYSGGGLLGALVAGRLLRWLSPRGVMIGVNWAWAALLPLFAVVPHPLLLGVVGAATAFPGPAWNVMFGAYSLLLVPDEMRGRVGSAVSAVSGGVLPLGSLAAGLLLHHAGALPAVLVLSGVMALTAAAATASRAVRRAPDLNRVAVDAGRAAEAEVLQARRGTDLDAEVRPGDFDHLPGQETGNGTRTGHDEHRYPVCGNPARLHQIHSGQRRKSDRQDRTDEDVHSEFIQVQPGGVKEQGIPSLARKQTE